MALFVLAHSIPAHVDWTWPACRPDDVPPRSLKGSRPNVIIIHADDLGYGDIEAFGGYPTSDTPALDALIRGGLRLNSIYSASPVCSPSRSSIMTGRYMTRNGVWPGVFSPASVGGLALTEITLPQLLRDKGGYGELSARYIYIYIYIYVCIYNSSRLTIAAFISEKLW